MDVSVKFVDEVRMEADFERQPRDQLLTSGNYLAWLVDEYVKEIRILDRRLNNPASNPTRRESRLKRRVHLAGHCLPYVYGCLETIRRAQKNERMAQRIDFFKLNGLS